MLSWCVTSDVLIWKSILKMSWKLLFAFTSADMTWGIKMARYVWTEETEHFFTSNLRENSNNHLTANSTTTQIYTRKWRRKAFKNRGLTGMRFDEKYDLFASHHLMKTPANHSRTCQNLINSVFYWPTNSNRSASSVKCQSARERRHLDPEDAPAAHFLHFIKFYWQGLKAELRSATGQSGAIVRCLRAAVCPQREEPRDKQGRQA